MSIRSRCFSRFAGIAVCLAVLFCACAFAQQQDTGFLKTKVDPGRAGVFVDGKYVGPAANFRIGRKYALPAGQHEVKLVEPRYEEFSTTVTITAGKTTVLRQAMKALPPATGPFGRLRVFYPADKFAAVYVNDHFYAHAGETNNCVQGILMVPGEYKVRVEPVSGGSPISQTVTIVAGQTAIVK